MARPMDPRALMPEGTEVSYRAQEVRLSERAEVATRDEARAPQARKPLRPKKERLPVAEEVDSAQLRNPVEPLLPGRVVTRVLEGPPALAPMSPPPAITFDGVVDNDTSIPPDTAGAVGLQHVFNPLNNRIQVFNRAGASLLDLSLDEFWRVLGPVSTFDPRVVYDPFRDRFVFVSMANAARSDSALLIAVSETGDPTGNWFSILVPVDPGQQGDVWLDYPTLGFSADKVTVQVNLFTLAGNLFAGSSVYVWDKDQLFESPSTADVRLFMLEDQGGTHVPAVTYDSNQADQFLVSRWSSNAEGNGVYAVYALTGGVSSGTVVLDRIGFVQTSGVTWSSFSPSGDFAPQRGTARRIDAGDDRILSAVFREGSLWFSHTVYLLAEGPDRTAAQWLEVETQSWQIRQLGRVDDPTGQEFYAFPTIAVNVDGHALIGMSRFAADQFAAAVYVLREPGDGPGQMRPAFVYAPGLSSYFKTFGGSDNRWGDYSATQVDPVNDRDFWTIQEYASEQTNVWATRWAQVLV